MTNCCYCRRSDRPVRLEPQSLPGTGTSSPFVSFSPVLSQAFRRAGTYSRRWIEAQKHPHLCIRNDPEEQTALAGWNLAERRKLPAKLAFVSEWELLRLIGWSWSPPAPAVRPCQRVPG